MSFLYDSIAKTQRQQILCCPGPVQLHRSTKQALAETQICHRDTAYECMQRQTAANIRIIAHASEQSHKIVFITGSGTTANETAIVALGKIGRLLILSNGEFGERLVRLAELHHEEIDTLSFKWGESINLLQVKKMLEKHKYAGIVVVHHETSTGMLNPISKIAKIAHDNGSFIYVDAVSSFGAEDFYAEKWGIDCFSTSSGKALASIPGIGILGITPKLANEVTSLPKTVQYLDLATYIVYADKHNQTPNTPSVHALAALEAATNRICRLGPSRHRATIYRRAQRVRSELTEMGLSYFNYPDTTSSVVTCVLPGELDVADLLTYMRENGIILYGGKGQFEGKIFQIGHIGELSPRTINYVLSTLRMYVDLHQRIINDSRGAIGPLDTSRGLQHAA